MAGKKREFSWSLSKARTFEECPRRYYYQQYFSKAGYALEAPDEARLALEMASISSTDMWAGDVVHQTVQWMLQEAQKGNLISDKEAKSEARRRLSEGWKFSVKQLWRRQKSDEHPNLFEHYYGEQIGTTVIDRIKKKVFSSVTNFANSSLYSTIAATPSVSWLPIEKYSSFRMDGLLFYVKLDFAMKTGEQITIYDWKTGKPTDDEKRQLTCYAMYASGRWDMPIENIAAYAVHLQPAMDMRETTIDDDGVENVRSFVKRSFNSMLKCVQNPERNIAAMNDFPMTGNLPRCVRCNFRGICSQGKQVSGNIEDIPIADDWWG